LSDLAERTARASIVGTVYLREIEGRRLEFVEGMQKWFTDAGVDPATAEAISNRISNANLVRTPDDVYKLKEDFAGAVLKPSVADYTPIGVRESDFVEEFYRVLREMEDEGTLTAEAVQKLTDDVVERAGRAFDSKDAALNMQLSQVRAQIEGWRIARRQEALLDRQLNQLGRENPSFTEAVQRRVRDGYQKDVDLRETYRFKLQQKAEARTISWPDYNHMNREYLVKKLYPKLDDHWDKAYKDAGLESPFTARMRALGNNKRDATWEWWDGRKQQIWADGGARNLSADEIEELVTAEWIQDGDLRFISITAAERAGMEDLLDTPGPMPQVPPDSDFFDLEIQWRVAGQPVGAAPEAAKGIPTMITQQMRSDLQAIGYKNADINKMKPEEAWSILRGPGGVYTGEPVGPPPLSPENLALYNELGQHAQQIESATAAMKAQGARLPRNGTWRKRIFELWDYRTGAPRAVSDEKVGAWAAELGLTPEEFLVEVQRRVEVDAAIGVMDQEARSLHARLQTLSGGVAPEFRTGFRRPEILDPGLEDSLNNTLGRIAHNTARKEDINRILKDVGEHARGMAERGEIVLPQDKKTASVIADVLNRAGKAWAEVQAAARGKANQVMNDDLVDYAWSNRIMDSMGNIVPYMKWAVRQPAIGLRMLEQNPRAVRELTEYFDKAEYERQKRGLSTRFLGRMPIDLPGGGVFAADPFRFTPWVKWLRPEWEWEEEQQLEGWRKGAQDVVAASEYAGTGAGWPWTRAALRLGGVLEGRPVSDLWWGTGAIRGATGVDIEAPYKWGMAFLDDPSAVVGSAQKALGRVGDAFKEGVPSGLLQLAREVTRAPPEAMPLTVAQARRDLTEMAKEKIISDRDAIEAQEAMEGPLWEQALRRAQLERGAWGTASRLGPVSLYYASPEEVRIRKDRGDVRAAWETVRREPNPIEKQRLTEDALALMERPGYQSYSGYLRPEELPMMIREMEFSDARMLIDDQYLPKIAEMERKGRPERLIRKWEKERGEKLGALYDEYEDVTETWKSKLPRDLTVAYGELIELEKYDEADALLANLAVPGTLRGVERERMMWEADIMGLTYDDFMTQRSKNDTPIGAVRRVMRDELTDPIWDILHDDDLSSEAKNAAKQGFDAQPKQPIIDRALELHPEWADDEEALAEMKAFQLPSFDELARVSKTPAEALQSELMDAIYRKLDGTARSTLEQQKVRQLYGEELSDAVHQKDYEWIEENLEQGQSALAQMMRLEELIEQGFEELKPEGYAPTAVPTEPAQVQASLLDSFSYAAAGAVKLMAQRKFGEELVEDYKYAKYPDKDVYGGLMAFNKAARKQLGLEYDKEKIDPLYGDKGTWAAGAVPDWFTPGMTSDEIAARLGYPKPGEEAPETAEGAAPTLTTEPAWATAATLRRRQPLLRQRQLPHAVRSPPHPALPEGHTPSAPRHTPRSPRLLAPRDGRVCRKLGAI
jgi:hypothetical protein